MSKEIILGIDTSNYTTSLALITEEGELIANLKAPLPVKNGECGLRQSDAVFAHIKNIPELMNKAREFLDGKSPCAVGVSVKPRSVEGSYMPCFLSGKAVAYSVAGMTGAKLFEFSHQCGHIMAALYSSDSMELLSGEFAALHVSGGTTDIMRVTFDGDRFDAVRVGGSSDLNAGQVIDRVGVLMGLPFPAGVHMERLALEYGGKVARKRPSVNGMNVNLSGLQNLAEKLYCETHDPRHVSRFVFDYIGEAIDSACNSFEEQFGKMPFVFGGGVMSNSILKKKLSERRDARFAQPAMSADNAVGIAVLAMRRFNSEKNT